MTGRVAVVGAGPSGLGCALALADSMPVTLIDRIPVVGGETGWRDPMMTDLARQALDRGVDMALGSAALRWDGERLLLAEPGRIGWLSASTLFYAGGLRPGTSCDLGITGDRPAGVVPATVALHLLETRVQLWQNVSWSVLAPGPTNWFGPSIGWAVA